jgi:hypothetical protein
LALGANVVAMIIADATLASYLFVYTPLKRQSRLSTTPPSRERCLRLSDMPQRVEA